MAWLNVHSVRRAQRMTTPSSIREQREGREIIRTGNQPASSFFQEAVKGRTLSGGSYEAERDTIVAGESAATLYPRLPESSPWSGAGAQVPNEEPLGVAIDQQEPTGTTAEVAATLEELATDQTATEPLRPPDGSDGSVIGGQALCVAALPAVAQTSTAPAKVSPPFARPPGDVKRRKV